MQNIEQEPDWDKSPYGYLQDSPLWNNTIDQYRSIIEKLQAKIASLESLQGKIAEDALRWAENWFETSLMTRATYPEKKTTYLCQFKAVNSKDNEYENGQ